MDDLELEASNSAKWGTYVLDHFMWQPKNATPLFGLQRSDPRGPALDCLGKNGTGAQISGSTYGAIATGTKDHGVLGLAKAREKAGVYGYNVSLATGSSPRAVQAPGELMIPGRARQPSES